MSAEPTPNLSEQAATADERRRSRALRRAASSTDPAPRTLQRDEAETLADQLGFKLVKGDGIEHGDELEQVSNGYDPVLVVSKAWRRRSVGGSQQRCDHAWHTTRPIKRAAACPTCQELNR